MRVVLREHKWLAVFGLASLLSIVSAQAAAAYRGVPPANPTQLWVLFAAAIGAWLIVLILAWLIRLRGASPLANLSPDAVGEAVTRFAPLLILPLLGAYFSAVKAMVPLFGGWRLDPYLARADWWLFLGHTPWKVTHALIGDSGTLVLDRVYQAWLVIVYVAAFLVAAFCGPVIRARFFVSWVLAWFLLGGALAIALASAGPTYMVEFGLPGHEQFTGLVENLQRLPLTALHGRTFLLETYRNGAIHIGSGISAAPSLHVAIASLLFLSARKSPLAIPAAVFLALIYVGSIHLGWHYAVDGLLGVAGAALIWRATRRLPVA